MLTLEMIRGRIPVASGRVYAQQSNMAYEVAASLCFYHKDVGDVHAYSAIALSNITSV